jgi:hypothetical protein
MALFLCPTHGTSPVQFVCAHLAQDFATERPLRSSRPIRILLRDIEPPNDLWFGTLLCDACILSLRIPSHANALYDNEVEARYQQLYQSHALCLHCFRQRTNPNES